MAGVSLKVQNELLQKHVSSLKEHIESVDRKLQWEKEEHKKTQDELKSVRNHLYDFIEAARLIKGNKSGFDEKVYQNEIDVLKKRMAEQAQQLEEARNKLDRKGTGRKRSTNTDDEIVLELRKQGKTVKSISEITGIGTATINRILAKAKKG